APEAAVPESQGGEAQPAETGTAASETGAEESSEPGAQSVVDSVLAEITPSPSEGSATLPETGPAAVPSDESAEARGASKAAIQTPDEGDAAIGSPATASESGSPASQVFLATDFEGEDLACWNGNRASNGVNRAGCGPYTSIGSAPFALTDGGIARSGRKAVSITYAKNEEAGGANVSLNSDSVNVRAYYYFEPGFD